MNQSGKRLRIADGQEHLVPSPRLYVETDDRPGVSTSERRNTVSHIVDAMGSDSAADRPVDVVNHPPHYTFGQIEIIDVIANLGIAEEFCVGNVIKYTSRYRHKDGIEDLKKAQWYLARAIAEAEKRVVDEKELAA